MANTFKVVTFAAEPASAGTAYKMYTCAGSTTTVVVLKGVVYTVYGVPAEFGSAAKVTTLKVFAIYFLLLFYNLT